MSLLELESVSSGYGKKQVLRDVAVAFAEGEFVAIIGPNGSGKSTLVQTILGFVQPWSGKIRFKGVDITRFSAARTVQAGIGYCPTGGRVFPDLTVMENLQLGGFLLRDPALLHSRMDRALEMFPVLKERAGQRAGTMSGGERQMLALARVLMLDPPLIMLDEPSMGLAPLPLKEMLATLEVLNREHGVTILLVEQNARAAFTVARRAMVMNLGEIVLEENDPDLDRMHDTLARVYMSSMGKKI